MPVDMGGFPEVPSGTSNPPTPYSGVFYRSDLGLLIYNDSGSRFLTVSEYSLPGSVSGLLPFASTNAASVRYPVPSDYNIYITRAIVSANVLTTNNGTAYWTISLAQYDSGGSIIGSALGSASTISQSPNVTIKYDFNVNTALSTSARVLYWTYTTVAGPGSIFPYAGILYRKIIT